jgi:hypothetical protein
VRIFQIITDIDTEGNYFHLRILKLVFQQQEEEIVALTLTQLPPQYVGTLVNELSIWMQKKGVQ